jgi:hypothetical protein
MIFWLVLKLKISYRVMISWRILVSFRRFFWSLYFCMAKMFEFSSFFFWLKMLFTTVNDKATVWHTPCLFLCDRVVTLPNLVPLLTPLWLPLEKALDKAVSTFQGPHSTFDITRKLLARWYAHLSFHKFLNPKEQNILNLNVISLSQN